MSDVFRGGRPVNPETQKTRNVISPEKSRDQAYKEFLDKLPERRRQVYNLVERYGPGTAREIYKAAKRDGATGMEFSTFQPRCTKELPERHLVLPVDTRRCGVTGKRVTVWDTLKNQKKEE